MQLEDRQVSGNIKFVNGDLTLYQYLKVLGRSKFEHAVYQALDE